MKVLIPVLALMGVFAIRTPLRADYQINISGSSPNAKAGRELVMKIKGSKIRMEMQEGKHVITDVQAGTRFLVDDQKKQVTDMSSMYQGMQANAKATPIKPEATGKKEKIGDYETEEYAYTVAHGLKISVWVAPDYPKDKADALKSLAKENGSKALSDPDLNLLPGPVIRTVVTDSTGTMSTQTEVKSVTEVSLDEKEFEVPQDYRVRKMVLPPGLQGKGK